LDSSDIAITNHLWGVAIATKIYDIQALAEDEPNATLFGFGLGDFFIFVATTVSTVFFLKSVNNFFYKLKRNN